MNKSSTFRCGHRLELKLVMTWTPSAWRRRHASGPGVGGDIPCVGDTGTVVEGGGLELMPGIVDGLSREVRTSPMEVMRLGGQWGRCHGGGGADVVGEGSTTGS
ncbi:unnamed protein product [Dovyalis caffra]|uniref:Uncharacterized protein n=1 Tax=Dovyalis caffra TaxID=77055 RepID=A0AAV1SRQ8_9ROSI|nr:unnamed protein product [Dovyalis caffra]